MTVRLPFGRVLLFAGLLLLELIALMPARLGLSWFGLSDAGLSAREASGSIWAGRLSEARFGPVALGDVQARLNLLPLFLGRARVDLIDLSGVPKGAIGSSAGGRGIDDVSATLPLEGLLAPLPNSSLSLTDVTVHFRDHECREASGSVRLKFAGDVAGTALAPEFSGPARCEGGALLLPLSGPGGESLTIKIFGEGRYHATMTIHSADPSTRDRALAEGFIARGDALALDVTGSLR